jgi:hypothetical protein
MPAEHDQTRVQLDYSSPAQEQARGAEQEAKRRQALDDYNESTFGEPHPYLGPLKRIAILFLVIAPIMWFLPRRLARPFGLLAVVAFIIWERWRYE